MSFVHTLIAGLKLYTAQFPRNSQFLLDFYKHAAGRQRKRVARTYRIQAGGLVQRKRDVRPYSTVDSHERLTVLGQLLSRRAVYLDLDTVHAGDDISGVEREFDREPLTWKRKVRNFQDQPLHAVGKQRVKRRGARTQGPLDPAPGLAFLKAEHIVGGKPFRYVKACPAKGSVDLPVGETRNQGGCSKLVLVTRGGARQLFGQLDGEIGRIARPREQLG
jgi:hypothetical protein